jgi:uncharacterized protein
MVPAAGLADKSYLTRARRLLMIVVGVDLAGSPKRPTGFCAMDGRLRASTKVLGTDEEILDSISQVSPKVVSIDAPLFLPAGRESLEKRGPPHFRECDKELRKMGIRFFPISLGPMRMLTKRGMSLRAELDRRGVESIESYPGAIQDMLSMPRKQGGLAALHRALTRYGVDFEEHSREFTGDELDAVTSALVGVMYVQGNYRALGDPREGLMIVPDLSFPSTSRAGTDWRSSAF